MSLLLDALKKAADDKEKNKKESSVADASVSKENELSVDMDLELEIDELPEVDEDDAKHQRTRSDTDVASGKESAFLKAGTEVKQPDVHESLSVDSEPELKDYASDDELLEITEKEIIPSSPKSEKVEEVVIDAVANAKPEKPKLTLGEFATERRRPSPTRLDSTIQMDAVALDALINKSNSHSRSGKMKKILMYAIGIFILLVGTSFYFFLEVTQSTESIYMAGANVPQAEDIVRRSREEELPKVEQVVAVPEKVQAVMPQINRPKVKQSQVASAPKVSHPSEKQVTIIHKKMDDPTDVLLRKAYQAFNDSDYTSAKKMYEEVLEKENKNKDALLGLAAVAVKEQRFEYAKQKYFQLLYIDPKDSYAKAGLSAIESQLNNSLSESQLKMMLREQPDAAHLHFALGSLYASKQNWPEAQAEFFSAWSTDNNNPDYAFNLAVSLDHMDQTRQAIEFYQLSIKLMAAGDGNFSKDDAQNRIRVLTDATNKNAN